MSFYGEIVTVDVHLEAKYMHLEAKEELIQDDGKINVARLIEQMTGEQPWQFQGVSFLQ